MLQAGYLETDLPGMLRRLFLCVTLVLPVGCAVQLNAPVQEIEMAFSPDAGAEALVLKTIGMARQSIRLAGYSFTSPAVIHGLVEATRRDVDVSALVEDRGNRSQAGTAALNLMVSAGIPMRVVSASTIYHDKYIVVDGLHTQTGSFIYSQVAAKSNSDNVLVWNNPSVPTQYVSHWESRWKQGSEVQRSN